MDNKYFEILNAIKDPYDIKDINEIKNYNSALSFNEKKILDGLDNIANKVEEIKKNDKNILNRSLNQIIKNTSTSLIEIMNEIILIAKNDNIKSEFWWKPYIYKLHKVFQIVTKEDRLIYLGFGLIVFSILIYFIEISS